MSNTLYYWYPTIKKMIGLYPSKLKYEGRIGVATYKAIDKAIDETADLPDGNTRLKIVYMVYMFQSESFTEASAIIGISKRAAVNHARAFVYLVALYAGFVSSQDYDDLFN